MSVPPPDRRVGKEFRRALGVDVPPEIQALLLLDDPHRWRDIDGHVDWIAVGRLASYHRVQGALAHAFASWTPPALPPEVRTQALATQQRCETSFREAALPQIRELSETFQAAGVALTLLKGASLLVQGTLRPGERPMHDIDVLVAPDEVHVARQLLARLGYHSQGGTTDREHAHRRHYQDVPWRHPRHPFEVDLHRAIRGPRDRLAFPVEDLTRCELLIPGGVAAYRLSPWDELDHLAVHFIGDRAQGRPGGLGQLRDVAVTARQLRPADWEVLRERLEDRGHVRTVALVLALVDLLDRGSPLPQHDWRAGDLPSEGVSSFAARRVLGPRPEHLQPFAVTPSVPHTPFRRLTRFLAYVRNGPPPELTGRGHAWLRHLRFASRSLLRALASPLATRDEFALDRWAAHLDQDKR